MEQETEVKIKVNQPTITFGKKEKDSEERK